MIAPLDLAVTRLFNRVYLHHIRIKQHVCDIVGNNGIAPIPTQYSVRQGWALVGRSFKQYVLDQIMRDTALTLSNMETACYNAVDSSLTQVSPSRRHRKTGQTD